MQYCTHVLASYSYFLRSFFIFINKFGFLLVDELLVNQVSTSITIIYNIVTYVMVDKTLLRILKVEKNSNTIENRE